MLEHLFHRVLIVIPLWVSLSVHEWAHAMAASALGDDTAREQGRLTLDPLAHLDWLGTVILPILGVPFGWAKPVPIEPTRFRSSVPMRLGVLMTALAGPASNLVLAGIVIGAEQLVMHLAPSLLAQEPLLHDTVRFTWIANLSLCVFNLLPIPPLDGSRIVEGLLPFEWRARWDQFARYGGIVLVVLVVIVMASIGLPLLWQ